MIDENSLIQRVMEFWFGNGEAPDYAVSRDYWFKNDPAFDERIRDQFGAAHGRATLGGLEEITDTPEGTLALIIILDQFSRNLYRDNPKAFENDPRALQLALDIIKNGQDKSLLKHQKVFLYMPLMHSEDIKIQNQCVKLFEAFGSKGFLGHAERHRDEIKEFGRFPTRNKILGRKNTRKEATFLKKRGS